MASCRVQRDSNNRIQKVTEENGSESFLFNFIASQPIISNDEEALDVYKNTLTNKIEDEDVFGYMVNGDMVYSYKEALKKTQEGEQIEAGFLTFGGDFISIVSFNKSTNRGTLEGFINNLIERNIIADTKKKTANGYKLQAAGNSENAKMVNSEIIADEAPAYLGISGVTKDGYTFDLKHARENITIPGNNGSVITMKKSELDNMSYKELSKITPYALDIVTAKEYVKNRPSYGFNKAESIKIPTRSENELQGLLLNLMNKLGVSTMSISEYVKKYQVRNGEEPSASALADIANKVIAFHNGEIGIEDLTEEVSHFIVEAVPQEETENVLRNIHRSEEWAKHSEEYRKVYSKYYSGEQLDEIVRKEVLGKVVANSILSRFDATNKSATQTNFLSRALDILTSFFERVQAYFQPKYKQELDSYLSSIEDIIRADELSNKLNSDNLEGSQFVLYSMNQAPKTDIKKSAEKAIMSIRDQIQSSLSRAKKGSSINKRKLESLEQELENNNQLSAVADINSLAGTYVSMLSKAIIDARKSGKSYVFTQEENVIFQALKGQLIPALKEINTLSKSKKGQDWKAIREEMRETFEKFDDLDVDASQQDNNAIERLIDKVIRRNELPDSSRDYIRRWIDQAEADTNWFHSNFGMLAHSRDGLLNLAGMLQKDVATESNINWQEATKEYQNRLRELGVSEKDISQFKDGQYIVSEYDFNKFDRVMDQIKAILHKNVTGSDMTIDEIIKATKNGTLEPLTSEQEVKYKRQLKDIRNPLLERKFKAEYYDKFEQKLKDLEISQEGIKYIMSYYGDMSQFKRAARTKVGDKVIMDFSRLSEQEKDLRNRLMKQRNYAKSYVNELGELKRGLMYNSQGEVVPDPDAELSENAQIALDLNKLDNSYEGDMDMDESGIPTSFLEALGDIEETQGREAALEFLFMNSFIGFSQEYWDQIDLGSGLGITSKLEELLNQEPNNQAARETLSEIQQDKFKLKSLIKVYRNKNNPSEVDVDAMPRGTKDSIKEIQERLNYNYSVARQLTKDINLGQGIDMDSESTVNDSYYKKLEDLGANVDFDNDSVEEMYDKVNEEIKFASEHMTDENRKTLNRALDSIEAVEKKGRSTVIPVVERALEELSLGVDDLLDYDSNARVKMHLARTRLLPYYTRFAPSEYSSFMANMNSADMSIKEQVKNMKNAYDFIEINPNFSFFDTTQNENLNPNFEEEFEGGYLQPKKNIDSSTVNKVLSRLPKGTDTTSLQNDLSSGFSNQKYQELFNGNTNSNLYKAYEATLDYNRKSLEAMGVGHGYNMYTVPQVKRKRLERFEQFTKNPSLGQIKEALNDELTYTEDDKIQGETDSFGDSIKLIPKMYVDRIDNPDDVSGELFFSLALRAQESYLRQARIDHYGDFMALYDRILNRTYKGKDVSSTNTLKMFESAMDYSLFGIKETAMYPIETMFGTIDVAKLARKILGFIKFRNLGLNVVIPITSYLTGRATREIEKYVGEHMNRRSQVLGDNEFRKLARESIGEIGEINTKAKLNVLGQYFKAFDMNESFENSNYGKHLRLLSRAGMMLHTGANFPIYGSTLLGVLHDFRVVNGSIMRFNQFERYGLSNNKSKEEIKKEWGQLENEAIYNYMDVKDSKVTFNDKKLRSKLLNRDGNKMSESEYQEFLDEKIQGIRGHISNVIANIDGQIPMEARVHAQRHFALNYFMTHRGWLSIVASRRFKHRHLNTETGEVEEGSYRTLWNFMGKYLKQFSKGNFTNFVQNWKNVYDNADPEEAQVLRRNMKRVGIEMTALNGLMLLGFLLTKLADDDDNKDNYAIQGASYLFNRTLNEMSSAQLGSINNFSEVIESPFVGWNTVKTFTDAADLFNGDTVKYGTYKGMSERQRFLTKLVPGAKQAYDLSSASRVKKMRDTYMFYNNANFNYSPLGNLYWLSEDK